MRRIASLLLALTLCLGLAVPVSAAESAGYSDIEGHYAKAAVEVWSGHGVLKGYPDGTFQPDGSITRAEMAVVLDRVMGYQDLAENIFTDVPEKAWYAQSVLHLAAEGILQGRREGLMLPGAPITRQEAFVALARSMSLEESEKAPGFTDDRDIADWAKGGVAAMKEAGYINGDKNGSIRPGDPITRAEVVTVLNNMAAGFVNVDGTYSADCKGNLVVNAHDVRLEDMTIDGDLIVADGVADGDVYIEKVTVKGDVILRGCGENSFHILPGCSIKNVIVTKTTGGMIRLVNESGQTIPMIWVNDGKAGVTLDGDGLGEVVIACDAPVTIAAKRVETLSVTGSAKLTVSKDTTVSSLELTKTAGEASVTVEGKVTELINDAGIKIDNKGSVASNDGSSGGSGFTYYPSSSKKKETLSEVTLQLLAPAFGNIPDEADVLGVGCSAKTEWFNADGSAPSYRWKAADSTEKDTFTADQAYKAVVTLSPVSGYTFADSLKVKVTDGKSPATEFTPAKSEKSGNNWVVTMEYEKTAKIPYVVDVEVTAPDYVYATETAALTLTYFDNYLTAPTNHTYQWYQCSDSTGAGKTAISGATGKTYTVPAGDIQNNRTPYYIAEVTVQGETYLAGEAKMIEVRDTTSITEADIPVPEFGEKLRFEDTPQEDILDRYVKFIDVSKLVAHPNVSYSGSVDAYGTKDGVESGGPWGGPWLESSGGSIVGKITEEGTSEIRNDYSSFGWVADVAYEDPTAVHEYVIDRFMVEVTPEFTENGVKRALTEKTGRITYNLDESEKIYYYAIGMEAEVEGEAAEYRPTNESKLIIDMGSGQAKFVNPDGSDGIPERCNYAMLWLPDTEYPQWSGTNYDRNQNSWMEYPFYVGAEWIKGVQEGKLEQQGRELCVKLDLCVPGEIDHHLYIYKVYIPADRIEFAGENG